MNLSDQEKNRHNVGSYLGAHERTLLKLLRWIHTESIQCNFTNLLDVKEHNDKVKEMITY